MNKLFWQLQGEFTGSTPAAKQIKKKGFMKIGILTHPLQHNYGGVLQAYALSTYLNRRGHEVVMIKRHKDDRTDWIKRGIKRFLIQMIIKIAKIERLPRSLWYDYLQSNFDGFINKYFENFATVVEIEQGIAKLDAVVVGSDQVWRKWGKSWDMGYYFADFAVENNIPVFSYAASLGADHWNFDETETERYKNWLKQYKALSVRESDSVGILKSALGVDSQVHLDPTLLLSKEDYKSIENSGKILRMGLITE